MRRDCPSGRGDEQTELLFPFSAAGWHCFFRAINGGQQQVPPPPNCRQKGVNPCEIDTVASSLIMRPALLAAKRFPNAGFFFDPWQKP